MPGPEEARGALLPGALICALSGLMMLIAPSVDHAPLTKPVFEFLRWACILTNNLLLGTILTALFKRQLTGPGVAMLWPLSLSTILPTAALYLFGYV